MNVCCCPSKSAGEVTDAAALPLSCATTLLSLVAILLSQPFNSFVHGQANFSFLEGERYLTVASTVQVLHHLLAGEIQLRTLQAVSQPICQLTSWLYLSSDSALQ